MKIAILKLLDFYFGRMLVAMLPKPLELCTKSAQNFLFIRPGGIGDAVLLIPTIKALCNSYPLCKMDVLVERRKIKLQRMCQLKK